MGFWHDRWEDVRGNLFVAVSHHVLFTPSDVIL